MRRSVRAVAIAALAGAVLASPLVSPRLRYRTPALLSKPPWQERLGSTCLSHLSLQGRSLLHLGRRLGLRLLPLFLRLALGTPLVGFRAASGMVGLSWEEWRAAGIGVPFSMSRVFPVSQQCFDPGRNCGAWIAR